MAIPLAGLAGLSFLAGGGAKTAAVGAGLKGLGGLAAKGLAVAPYAVPAMDLLGGNAGKAAAGAGSAALAGKFMPAGTNPAVAAALQTGAGMIGGNVIPGIVGGVANAAGNVVNQADASAMQRGDTGLFGGPVYGGMDQAIRDSVAMARANNDELLRSKEANYGITQKYAQAAQQRYMQQVAQQANYQAQLQRQAGAMNMAGQTMAQAANTDRALIQSANPYVGKIF